MFGRVKSHEGEKLYNEDHFKEKEMKGYATRMAVLKNAYKIFVEKE